MKTDLIETFQTLRASLQPYSAMGFNADVNTEDKYVLNSIKASERNGSNAKIEFVSLTLLTDGVEICVLKELTHAENTAKIPKIAEANTKGCMLLHTLKDGILQNIEQVLSEGFKLYKLNGWV